MQVIIDRMVKKIDLLQGELSTPGIQRSDIPQVSLLHFFYSTAQPILAHEGIKNRV